jgi:hypothetical protein
MSTSSAPKAGASSSDHVLLDRPLRRPRSRAVNLGCLTALAATIRCWRRAMFSARSSCGDRVRSRSSPPIGETGRVAVRIATSSRSAILATTNRTDRIRAPNTTCMLTISSRCSSLLRSRFLSDPAAEETSSHDSSLGFLGWLRRRWDAPVAMHTYPVRPFSASARISGSFSRRATSTSVARSSGRRSTHETSRWTDR